MLRRYIRGIFRKFLVFVTWIRYHHKFNLGHDVVIKGLKCVGKTEKVVIDDGATLFNCSFVFNGLKDNKLIIGNGCHLVNTEFILRNGGAIL